MQNLKEMQTLTITPHIENGRFYFELPNDLKDSEVTIQLILKKTHPENFDTEEKLAKIRAFAGIAKESGFEPGDAEWYQQ